MAPPRTFPPEPLTQGSGTLNGFKEARAAYATGPDADLQGGPNAYEEALIDPIHARRRTSV
jgi:hypothetical protein